MSPTTSTLKLRRALPRTTVASPRYPAMLCAAMMGIATAGCSDAAQDTPEGGDDAAVADGAHSFAEAGLTDAAEESDIPQEQMAGCSAAIYRAGPKDSWTAGAGAIALVLALGRRRTGR